MPCPTWKLIEKYHAAGTSLYRVSDDGQIESRHDGRCIAGVGNKWRPLKPILCRLRGGYLKVTLCGCGIREQRYIHDLVLEAFVGSCPDGQECLHDDGDPTNNRVGNLKWGTRAQNVADMIRHGTHFTPFAKFPSVGADAVAEVRRRHATGESTRAIAATMKIGKSTVWFIVARKGVYKE